jgi:hypothetical protein
MSRTHEPGTWGSLAAVGRPRRSRAAVLVGEVSGQESSALVGEVAFVVVVE